MQLLCVTDTIITHLVKLELKKLNKVVENKLIINDRFNDILLTPENIDANIHLNLDPFSTSLAHCQIRLNKQNKKIYASITIPDLTAQGIPNIDR